MSLEALLLHHEINQLNAAYAAALDERRFTAWPEFFTQDGRYMLQARENFDRKLPLCLMDLESKAMMQDRVVGITQTIYHAPYYTRHVLSPAQVLGEADGIIHAQTHYAVFRTKPGDTSEVFNAGRCIDALVREAGALKFKTRRVVYDSEMILNSVIYPI
jgi:salicylate 5-hydroxylase small subunit